MNVIRELVAAVVILACVITPALGADDDAKSLRAMIEDAIKHDGGSVQPPASSSATLRRWITTNADAMANLRRGELAEQPWGLTGTNGSRVYLYVFDWHTGGQLVVYGLTRGVSKACLLGDSARAALPAARVGSSTVFTVPKDVPDPLATVVVLESNGKLETTDLAAKPDKDGRIVLHARDAVVHGRTLRYEPQPNKDTLGYWTQEADWASWTFEIERSGAYAVEILQGCGKGSGGSEVKFTVGDQTLSVTVEDTGGFQNFKSRRIGHYQFDKPGRYTLTVKPAKMAGKAVMDLRSVTLTKEKWE